MQCEKCGAEVIDLGSPKDGETGWEYCPFCNNPRIENDDPRTKEEEQQNDRPE